ncbi:Solute carrier family 22 member 17 [Manis javanica]|nr:Solute carrier family 22 member 17 [Manis javanica]
MLILPSRPCAECEILPALALTRLPQTPQELPLSALHRLFLCRKPALAASPPPQRSLTRCNHQARAQGLLIAQHMRARQISAQPN